jgi:hypothetical protein
MGLWLWVAAALAAEVPSYRYVTPAEVEAAVRCVVAGETSGTPPELQLAWRCGKSIELQLRNDSASSVNVLWDRSAYVDGRGFASNLLPGDTRLKDAGLNVPASVVPPGATIAETLIPRAQVQGTGVATLLTSADEGRQVTVSLAVEVQGQPVVLTQRFDVSVDRVALSAVEANRRAVDRREDLEDKRGSHQTNALIYGLGTVGGAVLFGVMVPAGGVSVRDDPEARYGPTAWATTFVLAGASLGIGIPLTRKEWRAMKAVDDELEDLGQPGYAGAR